MLRRLMKSRNQRFSYEVPQQSVLDGLLVLLFAVGVLAYHQTLRSYLHGLDSPLILEFGFFTSLALACFYEVKETRWRYALAGCVVTVVVFAGGLLVAHWLREAWIFFVASISDAMKMDAGFASLLGEDFRAAITARYVGYGGSFALGLLSMRLVAGRFVRSALHHVFVRPENRATSCPCCGQLVFSRS
jgi:hypothetical protein